MRSWRLLAIGSSSVALAALAACGGDDEPETSAFEAACRAFCDASIGKCPVPNLTLERCQSACSYGEAQLGGQCVQEYTAVFECGTSGGFTCGASGPIPNDPCVAQNEAWMHCSLAKSCADYCAATAEAGCAPGGSASACTAQCNATRAEAGSCEMQYGLYLQCAAAFGVQCDATGARSADCDEDLGDVGSCMALTDACSGYCFTAVSLGCAESEACKTSCAAERDAGTGCDDEHASWIDCVLRDFAPICEAGKLTASSCSYERTAYETCAAQL